MPNTPFSAVPGAQDEGAPESQKAVSTVGDTARSFKDEVKELLGKEYPNDAEARKAVKETFNFVGKAGAYRKNVKILQERLGTDETGVLTHLENLTKTTMAESNTPQAYSSSEQAPMTDDVISKVRAVEERLDESTFYNEHPELKSHRELLGSLRASTGKSLNEVAEISYVKDVIEKARKHDEAERQKSVLHSNPRMGAVRDNMTQAKEAVAKGDFRVAQGAAMKAVLEAFPGKQA